MRIFVTGATGYIGTEVVRELLAAGHQVVGLTRSDQGAEQLEAAGAEAFRGTLEDLDGLKRAAAGADGVIHLAFVHDFSNFAASLTTDLRAVEAMGEVLVDTGKPFIITAHANGVESENAVLALAKRGVRTAIMSLAPSVHGTQDKGFVPLLIQTARAKGVSAYIGEGSNRWPAIHRLDAATLFRLAVEAAPAGSMLDGTHDEGIPFRDIAAVIGRQLNVPVVSIPREEAEAHFGFLGMLAAHDFPRSSAATQELLGWKPVQPGLLEDLAQEHYFKS
ncbi:SDR family oxidoreductase [Paenibacillus glycanilyticus]|uniref:NAD-dependent epimerase/dehydratase n=1 Tax=Paenibacillus glycanilyticus TaxID=126569 RepID=A0ABQ6GFV9_9BACL|nr:SDR family oxidoreductase [Paenibacillus glycanilyticus]GLX69844.1 putative NAD-dependent epimerase/dehydratase [Paenibacillus glycanilyticus]